MWARPHDAHVHVQEDGRPNQRYALLFRDYLRADATAADPYAKVKRMSRCTCRTTGRPTTR